VVALILLNGNGDSHLAKHLWWLSLCVNSSGGYHLVNQLWCSSSC
jgi:hypothetical protein